MGNARAFLVLGPESSGTRFTTEILIRGGCAGTSEHKQPFDTLLPDPATSPLIVWRRSLPHGESWPDLYSMIEDLRHAGYEVAAVVCCRDWYAMVSSQVRVGHAGYEREALAAIRHAYDSIFADLMLQRVPYWCISYESIVTYDSAIDRLIEQLGLFTITTKPEIVDGNAKYF